MNHQACDAESRGKLAFNSNTITSHADAEKFARKHYNSAFLQDCFVAGWNVAYWDEQARVLKETRRSA